MKLDRLFGFLDVESGIMGILTVQCMISALTGVWSFIRTSVEVLSQDGLEQLGALCVLGRLSPWVSIPYSDAFGMFVPVLILYLYLSMGNGRRDGGQMLCLGGRGCGRLLDQAAARGYGDRGRSDSRDQAAAEA